MSVENAAPATAPATESKPETAPEPKKTAPEAEKPKSKHAQKQAAKEDAAGSLRNFLKARLEAEDAEVARKPAKPQAEPKKTAPEAEKPAKADAEPSAQAEKLADKIEAAGGDAPDQKANESDKQYELRLAKTLRDLRDAKAEALKERKEKETATAELTKLQKLIEGGKANPLTVLDHLGVSYEDLTKGILEERFKPAHKRAPELPPDVQERIDRLEKAEKEREAEKVRAQAEAQRTKDVGVVKKYIEDHADEFPLAGSVAWAANDIVARTYAEGLDPAGALEALRELESNLAENVAGLLGSDKATKALLKKNPKLKAALTAALGLDATPAKPKDETPRSVADVATEASGKKMTKAELRAQAIAEFAQRRNARDED